MKNFAAIDFETANQHRSICSIGVVIVENGVIIDKFYELVKPEPNFFCGWATDCHGLTKSDTQKAKIFPEVWEAITEKIKDLPLVAHNSPFDEGCLRVNYALYDMEYPDYQFYCTLQKAREEFPNLLNHQLQTVSEHLGFKLDNHHHALADAEACAAIAIKIL
ncbi:MAG: exonuclease domain-containing protein [Marinilabiliaceae bacterium]|nr:exonuclease domain-containing protein [Marinilabiliaceae bacterium]